VDEVYKGYRIAIKPTECGWCARAQAARGPLVPVKATSSMAEGAEACLVRARTAVDRYIAYLAGEPAGQNDQ
jgi:hypothetical protein